MIVLRRFIFLFRFPAFCRRLVVVLLLLQLLLLGVVLLLHLFQLLLLFLLNLRLLLLVVYRLYPLLFLDLLLLHFLSLRVLLLAQIFQLLLMLLLHGRVDRGIYRRRTRGRWSIRVRTLIVVCRNVSRNIVGCIRRAVVRIRWNIAGNG